MKLDTKHFGEVDIDENKIIYFKNGIPGLMECTKFVLLTEEQTEGQAASKSPFTWMQSVQDKNVCFILIDASEVFPDYNPLVDEEELSGLGEYDPNKFSIYNIAKFPEDIREATVNLLAPVVINTELKIGKQVICTNDEYTVRHKLFR